MRPEVLSVRAVNQYRRRDMLAYLGLRYYLENNAAKRDVWAENVSTYLVNTRSTPIYFNSSHFKEISEQGEVIHRDIYIPGPNEILAEAYLLNECSLHKSFRSLSCVYSYHFSDAKSKEGVFSSYFPKYISRHQSIADVCKNMGEGIVRYTDIRKYYPSISKEAAQTAWRRACDSSEISTKARELGERLLEDYTSVSELHGKSLSVLTGPMFSHLIANLVLFEVDKLMQEQTKGRYWRYVDDIVLVGEQSQVIENHSLLKSMLGDAGLSLHEEGKDFVVDSKSWLDGINDFNDSEGGLWMNLISNIKRFLLLNPDMRDTLLKRFMDNGINIPVLDYSIAVMEAPFFERFNNLLMRYSWFPNQVRSLSAEGLVNSALKVRDVYQEKIKAVINEGSQVSGYKRKRILPKLRFYAGRLFYLATSEAMIDTSNALREYPEMFLEASVLDAIRTRDVTSLLKYGSNAVQAAAQVLRLGNIPVKCNLEVLDNVVLQGIALLQLSGIKVDLISNLNEQVLKDELNQFAIGVNSFELMQSNDPYIRELACLRGDEKPLQHQNILDTAFDRDEQLVFDVISQLRDSSYF